MTMPECPIFRVISHLEEHLWVCPSPALPKYDFKTSRLEWDLGFVFGEGATKWRVGRPYGQPGSLKVMRSPVPLLLYASSAYDTGSCIGSEMT